MFKTALLEAQVESTNEGAVVVDGNNRIVLHNRRFRDMWHIPQDLLETGDEAPVLATVLEQIDDPEKFLQRMRYLLEHKEDRGTEEIMLKDGRTLTWYSSPLSDAGGTYRGRVRYFRDITEPRNLRKKLERAAEEWSRTFDSIADMISIQDKDFKLIRANKAYTEAFKKQPQELIGKTCYSLVHGTDCPMHDCPQQRTLQTAKAAREEYYEPYLGIYLEVNTSPLFGENGDVVATVHVARNITKRRELEEQLMLADRLASIGELASGVAHELNNPLTTIVGFSQLLMEREVPGDIKNDLALIHSESRRAAGIIKNLLTFARRHEAVKQPTKIDEVIEEALNLRAYEHEVNNIKVIRRFAANLPQIAIDYFQMQQVFVNLTINAEFFMIEAHKQGRLTITTEAVDGMVRISFADDGPGIAPEHLDRLFDPFFTTKEVGKGTGLGLSICHGIVAGHNGKIYATSQPGAGATFIVELPFNGH